MRLSRSRFELRGECLVDVDQDGVCEASEFEACTDNAAINFNCTATEMDDSCVLATSGCTFIMRATIRTKPHQMMGLAVGVVMAAWTAKI